MKLIIVESPNKTKKIQKFVGDDYLVMASVGHIRDMPSREMGVAAPDYKPVYQATEEQKKRIKRLKEKAAQAEVVYLATDPDREGEAIAWHLLDTLKPKRHKRIKFNAITKTAVNDAIANPGEIDMNLVHSQEGRRVLDRLVGYTVSPLLNQISGSPVKLSAGRVQTPAVLVVVDLEHAIANFSPTDHYKLKAHFPMPDGASTWKAVWQHKALQKALNVEQTELWTDKNFVTQVAAALATQSAFMVFKAEGKEVYRNPPAPFSTSKLQQVANTTLGFGVDQTMKAAQTLFEAGLITYHRTDSLNLDPEPAEEIRQWLSENNLPIPAERNTWKSKDDAQEAHEAIRPTDVNARTPDDLPPDSDAAKLYKLIWERAFTSQMAPAKYFSTTAVLVSALQVQGVNLQFIARGRTLLDPGFLALSQAHEGLDEEGDELPEDSEDDDEGALPSLQDGQRLTCLKGESVGATTKPPPRLTVAKLVAALERNGIGRPSTYASIINTIFERGYVELKSKKIYATELGKQVIELLRGRFSFVRLDFTRVMEKSLDRVAKGEATYLQVVTYQHDLLTHEVQVLLADPAIASIKASMQESFGDLIQCPVCSKGTLLRRKGAGGHFWSCNAYPECTASCNDKPGTAKSPEPDLDNIRTKSTEKKELTLSEVQCPKCKKSKLALRPGSKGNFWGCTGFPKCKATFNDADGKPEIEGV